MGKDNYGYKHDDGHYSKMTGGKTDNASFSIYDKINIQTADLWKQENKLDERTKVKITKDILNEYKYLLVFKNL